MRLPSFTNFLAESSVEGTMRTMTLYHGVRDPQAVQSILKEGFKLHKIEPRWQNDLAVSTLTTEKAVREYFNLDRGLTILKLQFKGRVAEVDEVGYVSYGGAREYTNALLERGIDAVRLNGTGSRQVFVYNVKAIKSVSVAAVFERVVESVDGGLETWADGLKTRLGLQAFDAWLRPNGTLHLETLIVPKGARKAGLGTAAMEAVCEYADEHGLRVTLTPGQRDDAHGTTSHARLVDFYKRFGFVENRGRNTDFTLSARMYRDPMRKR